jgi:UDP-galactopyranose mutase
MWTVYLHVNGDILSRLNHVTVVGAGISGATIARALADAGVRSTVYEAGPIAGGMCREAVWKGHLVSEFGPHIFRTSSDDIWRFVTRFDAFVETQHHVVTAVNGRVVPFPPATDTPPLDGPFASVGAYLLAAVGQQFFEEYYDEYTRKRWGVSAFELSPSMIPLIPVRRHRSGFFSETHIGMPVSGYTSLIHRMLDHPLIELHTSTSVTLQQLSGTGVIVWTGRLDEIHPSVAENRLPFRAVRQEFEFKNDITDQPEATVVNFPRLRDPYIRRTDYSMLLPWRPPVVGLEYVDESGMPAYPVMTSAAEATANTLLHTIERERPSVIPHGRLGRFSYISMDRAVASSLEVARDLSGRP